MRDTEEVHIEKHTNNGRDIGWGIVSRDDSVLLGYLNRRCCMKRRGTSWLLVVTILLMGAVMTASAYSEELCAGTSGYSATSDYGYSSPIQSSPLLVAKNCAKDGSPCSDPNNPNPQWPVCKSDCCSKKYHECDGLACICGPRK
jgi:hypothetical protein